MTALLKKHSTIILISLLIMLLVLAWLSPSARLGLEMIFLLASLCITSLVAIEKHQETYAQGKVTRSIFIRNGVLEITGILLVMVLAGLLGRSMAEVATRQISGGLARVAAGILVGLLVGMGVGAPAKRIWRRLVNLSPGR